MTIFALEKSKVQWKTNTNSMVPKKMWCHDSVNAVKLHGVSEGKIGGSHINNEASKEKIAALSYEESVVV